MPAMANIITLRRAYGDIRRIAKVLKYIHWLKHTSGLMLLLV